MVMFRFFLIVWIALLVDRSNGFTTSRQPQHQAVSQMEKHHRHTFHSPARSFDVASYRPTPLRATSTTALIVVGHVLGGAAAAPLTAKAIRSWYSKISLPRWTPPNQIFGPTWTLLYASMGYAASRILKHTGSVWYITLPMQWWIVHCTLNLLWAPVFFGLQQFRTAAVINIALLGTLVGGVGPTFFRLDPTAAFVLVPYALWLVFANALNISICRLNPGPYNAARFQSDLQRLQRQAATYAGL